MKSKHFETLAIRTQLERSQQKEHSVPVYLTSSYSFGSAEEAAQLFAGETEGNIYSRYTNPNTSEFIEKLTLLEGVEAGVATATGMAAVYSALAGLLKQGDHIVASSAIFGNTFSVITGILPQFGIEYSLVEVDDNEAWKNAIKPNTKALFVESPSNPTLKIADLEYLGNLAKAHGLIFMVDNCFATPYLQQPASFGADLVLHSATKYIDGQGRVLGGAILGKKEYVDPCFDFAKKTGAALSPFNAWVLSKSLETLAVRMDRHCENAEKVVQFLESHPEVEEVLYPFHKSNPRVDLAKKQMKKGGGLVGCVVKGGIDKGRKFLNALNMISLTANLGDTRTIATHPASTTHSKMTEEERLAVGITPGFVRFSVGLENSEDIIADIDQALKA